MAQNIVIITTLSIVAIKKVGTHVEESIFVGYIDVNYVQPNAKLLKEKLALFNLSWDDLEEGALLALSLVFISW